MNFLKRMLLLYMKYCTSYPSTYFSLNTNTAVRNNTSECLLSGDFRKKRLLDVPHRYPQHERKRKPRTAHL